MDKYVCVCGGSLCCDYRPPPTPKPPTTPFTHKPQNRTQTPTHPHAQPPRLEVRGGSAGGEADGVAALLAPEDDPGVVDLCLRGLV